tara:strand:- start:375 stop:1037 length:663 start_codon:yes stop_codon:yes gene_type:complete
LDRITYDNFLFDFRSIVVDWFEVEGMLPPGGLERLHFHKSYDLFERENDQSTIWHKCFYDRIRIDNRFDHEYMSFLSQYIKPRFNEEIVYQKIPTLRIHLPGNVSVGEFHKDKHYRNKKWANQVRELNYFVPLTKAYGTNTIWAETQEDLGDFQEIRANYGECVEWSATKLTHGNKQNITRNTRVSFDFRVIPKSRYVESNYLTINTKIPFGIGGYYEVL